MPDKNLSGSEPGTFKLASQRSSECRHYSPPIKFVSSKHCMIESLKPRQEQEWQVLQTQFAGHESHALHIRLCATGLFALALSLGWSLRCLAATLLVLWLLEAMIRTTQTRIGQRLLQLEAGLRNEAEAPGLQLHSWWAAQRGGLPVLVKNYACAGLRPGVALPYVLLLAANVYALMR